MVSSQHPEYLFSLTQGEEPLPNIYIGKCICLLV